MKLDPAQQVAVGTKGNLLISACPGSGKTSTLAARGASLLAGGNGSLAAVSFTRDSAQELSGRILKLAGEAAKKRIIDGTFHSLAIQQWKAAEKAGKVEKVKLRIASGYEIGQALMRVWSEVPKTDESLDFEGMQRLIEAHKAQMGPPKTPYTREAVALYNETLRRAGCVDFSDLLLRVVDGLRGGYVDPLPVRWMLVDEGQDLDEVQLAWVEEHLARGVEVTLVGDDDQCHPGDVEVLTAEGNQRIDEAQLSNVLRVKRIGRSDTRFEIESRTRNRAKRGSRPYSGRMLTLSAGGNSVDVTPRHKLLVRRSATAGKKYAVIASMRSDGFACVRVVAMRKGFMAYGRSMYENGAQVWFLSMHDRKADAEREAWESVVKKGIPMVKRVRESDVHPAEAMIPNNRVRLHDLLCDYGQSIDAPLLHTGKKHGSLAFIAPAGALIAGLVDVPVQKGNAIEWMPLDKVDSRNYQGEVYSLDVPGSRLYVANGIVVHNSIYEWRNALGYMGMERFERSAKAEHVVLGRCYRCPVEIIDMAGRIIENNKVRRPKRLESALGTGGYVEARAFSDREKEMDGLVAAVTESPGEWAVLARVNHHLRMAMGALQTAGIPYRSTIESSIWDRKDVGAYTALLESLSDDVPAKVLEAIAAAGIISAEKQVSAGLGQFKSASRMVAWLGGEAGASVKGEAGKNAKRLDDLAKRYPMWREMAARGDARATSLATSVCEWMVQAPKGDEEQKSKRGAAIVMASGILGRLQGSAKERIRAAKDYAAEARDKNIPGAVQILTMHGSKGLEFPCVWIMGAEEDNIPKAGSPIEEERRLFYVGATRARKRLVVSYEMGEGGSGKNNASRFLREAGLENVVVRARSKRDIDLNDGPLYRAYVEEGPIDDEDD